MPDKPSEHIPSNAYMADFLEKLLADAYERRRNSVTVFMPRQAIVDVIARLRNEG